MFRKFRESPYFKAALVILLCGGVLIMFHNWVSSTHFSVGFDTLNKTLAPIYIGCIFAFILCPVYNAVVKRSYHRYLKGAKSQGFSVGAMVLHREDESKVIDKTEKRRLLNAARAWASLVCVIMVVGLVGLLIYFVVPQVVTSTVNLVNTLPERLTSLSAWLSVHFSRFPILSETVDSIANAGTEDIIEWIQAHILNEQAVNLAGMISSGVMTAFKSIANAFIGLLIMVYLLNYKERLFAITRKIVNATCGPKRKATLYEFAGIVNETFIGFIVGRIIDSFIIGVLTFIVLKLFAIPFAVMISVIVGITNVIPFFGPFIGAIPSAFILLLEEPEAVLYFVIIIIVIQQIDGNIIGPKIVGNAIGISSFWVLCAVLIGGGLFGFPGMALSVPVFAVVYRYVDKITMSSLKHRDKEVLTSYYFVMDQYGIDDDEINLDGESDKQHSLFERFFKRKPSKGNKKFYDPVYAPKDYEKEEKRKLLEKEQESKGRTTGNDE